MTIKEAIELLNLDLDDPGSVDILDLNEAQKLGIESLKRLEESRNLTQIASLKLLPGEKLENTL